VDKLESVELLAAVMMVAVVELEVEDVAVFELLAV